MIPLPTLVARLSKHEQQLIADYRVCRPSFRKWFRDAVGHFAGRLEYDTAGNVLLVTEGGGAKADPRRRARR